MCVRCRRPRTDAGSDEGRRSCENCEVAWTARDGICGTWRFCSSLCSSQWKQSTPLLAPTPFDKMVAHDKAEVKSECTQGGGRAISSLAGLSQPPEEVHTCTEPQKRSMHQQPAQQQRVVQLQPQQSQCSHKGLSRPKLWQLCLKEALVAGTCRSFHAALPYS